MIHDNICGHIKVIIFYSHYMIRLCSCLILSAKFATCDSNMVGVLFFVSIAGLTCC